MSVDFDSGIFIRIIMIELLQGYVKSEIITSKEQRSALHSKKAIIKHYEIRDDGCLAMELIKHLLAVISQPEAQSAE
jgi:hypothetical protein